MFWKKLQDVHGIKSIIGLLDDYDSFNGLLDLQNPALTWAIMSYEKDLMNNLLKISILQSNEIINQINIMASDKQNAIFVEKDIEKLDKRIPIS